MVKKATAPLARDLSPAEQGQLAEQEAAGEGSDTSNIADEANVTGIGEQEKSALVGDNVAMEDKPKPASLSMALDSDVSGDGERVKERQELRQLRGENTRLTDEVRRLGEENTKFRMMLDGIRYANGGNAPSL